MGNRPRVVAVTGATGFIGRRLIPRLAASGWQPRVLVRKDPADVDWGDLRIEVVQGDLQSPTTLDELVEGAGAVIHVAGLIKAPSRQAFMEANVEGTRRLAEAALRKVPSAHFVLVSSLAARSPELSAYAESKAAAEIVARELLGDRLSIVRPPAVFGPGDRETLAFFKLVSSGFIPRLGSRRARMAIVHVDDLCSAFAALLDQAPTVGTHAVTDARAEGYSWDEILGAAARAQGIEPRASFGVPPWLLQTVAAIGDLRKRLGESAMLSSEKLRELLHEDWAVRTEERLVPAGWSPQHDLQSGFADAVHFYRQHGWLSAR